MRRNTLTEEIFLKNFIITLFNAQKNIRLKPSECDIFSIRSVLTYKYAYEITTTRRDDNFRIRFYFNIAKKDAVSPFTLVLDETKNVELGLGDEIYETRGTIDQAHVIYNGYRFETISKDLDEACLLQSDFAPFVLVNGGYLLLAK